MIWHHMKCYYVTWMQLVTWCDMIIWYDMKWLVMTWYDMVWYDMMMIWYIWWQWYVPNSCITARNNVRWKIANNDISVDAGYVDGSVAIAFWKLSVIWGKEEDEWGHIISYMIHDASYAYITHRRIQRKHADARNMTWHDLTWHKPWCEVLRAYLRCNITLYLRDIFNTHSTRQE